MPEQVEELRAALGDRYEVERELGRGGMATVYLAHDHKHRRRVAIKVLHPDLAAALGADRFLLEIEICANLRHPHILPLYDSGSTTGFLYYVMPHVEGESLRDRLERESQLPVDDAVAITKEVADALAYAHARGVVHRDIKPENILLESGHAAVADFGIARAIGGEGNDRLTATGVVIGTPAYMSPEQASGTTTIDGRSDIYSLGCVLYEMLAGDPPFTGPTEGVVVQHLTEAPVTIHKRRDDIPKSVGEALRRSLAKSASDRYSSATDFVKTLDGSSSGRPKPEGGAFRRRKSLPFVVGAVAVAVVLFALSRVLIQPAAASFFNERDPVLIAEFENDTSDPALGFAVRQAVVADLDQSPYVRVIEPSALTEVVRQMRLPDSVRVDESVALDAARREGFPAVITGRVTPIGGGYQLSAAIIETSTGEAVARVLETAADDTQIIAASEKVVRLVRRHLGESLRSIRRSAPLPEVTTASLDALELAAQGFRLGVRGEYGQAIALLEQAVELDTAFAAAFRALSIYNTNIGNPAAAQRYVNLAYRHGNRLHPMERYLIASGYHGFRGRVDSAAYYYERILTLDPEHPTALNNVGDAYERMGRYELALDRYRRAARRGITVPVLVNLASVGRSLGDHAFADSVYREMRSAFPNIWETWGVEYNNAMYANAEERQWLIANAMASHESPFPRAHGRWAQSSLRAMRGQIDVALALADTSLQILDAMGNVGFTLRLLHTGTWSAFAAGAPERALDLIERMPDPTAVEGAPLFRLLMTGFITRVYALAGRRAEAEEGLRRLSQLSAEFSLNPLGLEAHVRAILALTDEQPREALDLLARATNESFGLVHHSERLLRAEALAALGNTAQAAAQYDTLAGTTGLNFLDMGDYGPLRPVAHERAGNLYLQLGDTSRGLEHLTAFLELWEDADPELQPIVRQTRAVVDQLTARR